MGIYIAPPVQDYTVRGYSNTYSIARSTSVDYWTADTLMWIGQFKNGTTYEIYRYFVGFNTSAIADLIGDNAITQVNMRMTPSYKDATEWTLRIVKATWAAFPANTEANYDLGLSATLDDDNFGLLSNMTVNAQKTSNNLNTAYINKTGITYYCLISSKDRDGSGTAPIAQELFQLYTAMNATPSLRPDLVIQYTDPTPSGNPAISPFFMIFQLWKNRNNLTKKGGIWQSKELGLTTI